MTQLWLQIASVLACFTIEKAKDKSGNEIEVDTTYEESGLLMWVSTDYAFEIVLMDFWFC